MRAAADDFCEIVERNKDRCDPRCSVKWTCLGMAACAIGSVFYLLLDTLYSFPSQSLYVPMMGYAILFFLFLCPNMK